jgi:hypothetical protein
MLKHSGRRRARTLTSVIVTAGPQCAPSVPRWLISARQSAIPLLAPYSPVIHCALSDPSTFPTPSPFKFNHLACALTTSSAVDTSLFSFSIRSAIGWSSARDPSIAGLLFFGPGFSTSLSHVAPKQTRKSRVCSVPFPIDLAPISHPAPPTGHGQIELFFFSSRHQLVFPRGRTCEVSIIGNSTRIVTRRAGTRDLVGIHR